MKLANIIGAGVFAGGALSNQELIQLIGILIMLLSMLQQMLKDRKT